MRPPGLLAFLSVCVGVLALEGACQVGLVQKTMMPPPSEIASNLVKILMRGQFNAAIAQTMTNVCITIVSSIVLGLLAGIVLHANNVLRRGIEPLLASYYAVPTLIFYPVFVLLFGVGSGAIVAISILLAIVAMITATLNGLDHVPTVFERTGRVMRLTTLQQTLFIQVPASIPYLFTGARLAIAYSFIGVIASEFILSGEGLGYAIAYAYNNFDNVTMYALMLLIIAIVTVINLILDRADRYFQSRLAQ